MQNEYIENPRQVDGENKIRILLSSLAQLNPITSAMAEAYNQHMDEKRWRYTEEFFQETRQIMESHEERLLELYDTKEDDPAANIQLMHIAIDNVKLEYQEDRRKRYAKLFVNSILIGNQINFDEKKTFFHLFSELSELDITLFGEFYRNSHHRIDLENYRKHRPGEDFGLAEVVPLVIRLESKGLIYEIPNAKTTTHWEGASNNFDSIWRNKIYSLTPIGIKFSMFLKGD